MQRLKEGTRTAWGTVEEKLTCGAAGAGVALRKLHGCAGMSTVDVILQNDINQRDGVGGEGTGESGTVRREL